jgi:DNA-binding IclR family transcriptional regulator
VSNGERTGIQSVARAVGVLQALADSEGELGVTELGRRLGVHKATASRLVATLAEHRLVERNPMTDKYRLGFGLIHLAGSAMAGMDLTREARPVLEDLAERTQETVNLAVLDGDAVLNVDQITSPRTVASRSWVGRRTPWHCTSNGKVLVAWLTEPERGELLSVRLEPHTDKSITDRGDAARAARRDRHARLRTDHRGTGTGPERRRRSHPGEPTDRSSPRSASPARRFRCGRASFPASRGS